MSALAGLQGRDAVLDTYARADVTLVEGEGCRVRDTEGRSTSTLAPGSRSSRSGTVTRP